MGEGCFLSVFVLVLAVLFYLMYVGNVAQNNRIDARNQFARDMKPSWPNVNPFNATEVFNHAIDQMYVLKSPCVVLNYQSSPLEVRKEVIRLFESRDTIEHSFYGKTGKSGYLVLQVYNNREKVNCYSFIKELFID
jgi:hypothetical protein